MCVHGIPPPPHTPTNGSGIVNPDLASQLLKPKPHLSAGWVTARGDPTLPSCEGQCLDLGGGAAGQAPRAARLRALRLSPAGARTGCRRLLPVQTFLSSSSSRPPDQLLGARRPAPGPAPASGSRRGQQLSPRRRPHPALRAGDPRSQWPRPAGAPRSPRGSQSGRWRPKPPSPRCPPRRGPHAGSPGTRAPAAAPRATCRRAQAGAAHSGSTSPAQVGAGRGAGDRPGPGRAGAGRWRRWPGCQPGVLGHWSRRLAAGGEGLGEAEPPRRPAARLPAARYPRSEMLEPRCRWRAGGRASLRGRRAAAGSGSAPAAVQGPSTRCSGS